MFGNLLTGWHLVIILAVVVLLFGATKLPALAKGVGSSIRIFRGEMKAMEGDASKSDSVSNASAAPAAPSEPLGKQ
jgi:sec-independent protein translocase protein TatA